jgi:uncharacterized protein (TIGR03066 family)
MEVPMRWLSCASMGFVVLALMGCGKPTSTTGPSQAAKKEPGNSEKIVGVWEVTKSADAPPGAVFEFTKDGKMKISFKANDKDMSMEMTYKVEGDTITATSPDGKAEPAKIKKLTDTELAIEDSKGKVDEYKKKK